MTDVDRERRAAYAKAHYEANKEKYKARARAFTIGAVERNRKFVDEKKSAPCTDCKMSYPPYVMDFDHVRDDKTNNVATGVLSGWSLERLQVEIDKCELVCSNCHRIRTHLRKHDAGCCKGNLSAS